VRTGSNARLAFHTSEELCKGLSALVNLTDFHLDSMHLTAMPFYLILQAIKLDGAGCMTLSRAMRHWPKLKALKITCLASCNK
jgi:hypothetical protein